MYQRHQTEMAQSATKDQDEALFFGLDRRRKVPEESLKSPPFVRIVRLVVEKPCCEPWNTKQGTCFLVKCDQADDYWRYVTAGHVLFCARHGRFAESVKLVSSSGTGIVTLTRGASDSAPGWYAVNEKFIETSGDDSAYRQHDFGMVAVEKSKVPRELTESGGFSVCSSVPTKRENIRICGYPVTVRRKVVEELYDHEGAITRLDRYHDIPTPCCLWEHRVDTSGGQSGAPVYNRHDVFGIHIGWGSDSPNSEVADRNLAVVLNDKLWDGMLKGGILKKAGKDVSSVLTGSRNFSQRVRMSMPMHVSTRTRVYVRDVYGVYIQVVVCLFVCVLVCPCDT